MNKFFLVIGLIVMPATSLSSEFEYALGVGLQYGALGGRVAYKTEESKYYVALGLLSASAGIQTTLTENQHHSWGASIGRISGILSADSDFATLNYSYHLDGFHKRGWEFGLAVGYHNKDAHGGFFSEPKKEESGEFATFNIGYAF